MSITPTGVFSRPAFKLRSMLAQCATVQSLLKAANAAAALALIPDQGSEGEASRPCLWVSSAEDSPEELAGGTRSYFKPHGRLEVYLQIPRQWEGTLSTVTDASNLADALRAGHANDLFNGFQLKMQEGEAAGEARTIQDFDGTTGAMVLASALPAVPEVGQRYTFEAAGLADAYVFVKNQLGAIRSELLALSGLGSTDPLDASSEGYLSIRSIRLMDWGESLSEQEKSFFGAKFEVEFGI